MKRLASVVFLMMILLSGCETAPSKNSNDNMRVGGRASGSNDYVGGKLGVGSKF